LDAFIPRSLAGLGVKTTRIRPKKDVKMASALLGLS